jgi:eukaryotic-like serine/threonine-protein kinase
LETGEANWTIATWGEIQGDLIVTNGIVVSVTGDADHIQQIFALDLESGESLWQVEALMRDGNPMIGINSLTASDGVIVVTGIGGIMAFDEKSGQFCWGTSYWTTFGGASAADGVVFAANSETGDLASLDIRTGDLLWESGVDMGLGNPATVDGTVFFGGRDGRLHAVGASNGEIRWESAAGDFSWANPIEANGTVFAASADGLLYAFDAATGAPRWTFNVGPVEIHHTAPLVLNDVIYIGSDTSFYAIWGS